MAGKQNFSIDQGADWRQELVWKDEADTPIDLTGWTARMQIRRTAGSATELVELTTENSRIALGGAAGTIVLTLDHDTTEDLPFTTAPFVYDLELIAGLGTVTRLLQGKIKVVRNVTREDP